MLAKHVSPPTPGSRTARRMDPRGGLAMKVLSLCHSSAPSPLGDTWSSTVTDGLSWYLVASGDTLIGPKRRANARCCSSVRSWSRKKTTRWSSSTPRMAATVLSSSGSRRSTPEISAPMAAVRGWTSIDMAAVASRT